MTTCDAHPDQELLSTTYTTTYLTTCTGDRDDDHVGRIPS